MKIECIEAVKAAAGRALTQAEIKDIEDRVKRNQRQLAGIDRQKYLSMTPEERLREAGKLAAQELKVEAMKKKQRVARTIQAHDRIGEFMAEQKAKKLDAMDTLQRLLAFVPDGKGEFALGSVETRANAIAKDYIRNMVGAFEAVEPRIFGLFANREGIRALTYELFGRDSRSIVDANMAGLAKQAAKVWLETAEAARLAFNNGGGKVGKLEDWRMPQSHSQYLVAKATKPVWVRDIFGKLDRARYIKEDGTLMNDAEVIAFLEEVWTTIATGGANKIEPGKITGRGMLANHNSESRSIHFKDADSYLKYQEQYGGTDAYTAMMKHILSVSGDIAMLEVFGPNPDLQFKYWLDKAVKESSVATPRKTGKIDARAESLQNLYDYMAGKTRPVANEYLARGFDTLRNWLVSTRLGSAFITSITDNATMQLTAAVNNMSHMQLLRNQLQTLNPANQNELRMARRAALSLNTLIGEMNRWGAEALGPSFSGKMASLTIRLSALNAASEARRRAFGVTMYGSIGAAIKDVHALSDMIKTQDMAQDARLLKSKGVTENHFAVWKQARLEDWGNGNDTMLTPESIYRIPDSKLDFFDNPAEARREAALKLIGMVDEEINMAVIEPGARERAMMKMGMQRGTWKGEIVRSFFLFKSFPIALIMRHWGRGLNMPTAGGKAAYIASLMASTTILGAAAQQIYAVMTGKDPNDMSKATFWGGAFLKGGSLGIYGDFLLNTETSYGSSPLGVLGGPVAGFVEDLDNLTRKNAIKAAKGEKTHFNAELVRFLKSNIPMQNLWYTRAATDHLIFNQIQEMVSPGYMRRVESRARNEYGQTYYWPPGNALPQRAPDMGKPFGE